MTNVIIDASCLIDLRKGGLLRKVAENHGVRVHGVFWIIDELFAAQACEHNLLISALQVWQEDDAVFLPAAEINKLLRRLRVQSRR